MVAVGTGPRNFTLWCNIDHETKCSCMPIVDSKSGEVRVDYSVGELETKAQAMRAAWMLKEDYGIETRVVNVHTVKPLDTDAIVNAAGDAAVVITAEEHQVGGFGNLVAGVICKAGLGGDLKLDMVGVQDRYGESGQPWELMKIFGLTAEHIADKARKLLEL